MDEKTLGMITDSIKATISECNSKTEEFESQIAELNSALEAKTSEVNSLTKRVSELEATLEATKSDVESISAEKNALVEELNSVKIEQKKSELNTVLADFTDEQKEYAKAEIEAFNADPIKSEINSITSKIYEGIGKATKVAEAEQAKVLAEQNSRKDNIDIFADVDDTSTSGNNDDGSIY